MLLWLLSIQSCTSNYTKLGDYATLNKLLGFLINILIDHHYAKSHNEFRYGCEINCSLFVVNSCEMLMLCLFVCLQQHCVHHPLLYAYYHDFITIEFCYHDYFNPEYFFLISGAPGWLCTWVRVCVCVCVCPSVRVCNHFMWTKYL